MGGTKQGPCGGTKQGPWGGIELGYLGVTKQGPWGGTKLGHMSGTKQGPWGGIELGHMGGTELAWAALSWGTRGVPGDPAPVLAIIRPPPRLLGVGRAQGLLATLGGPRRAREGAWLPVPSQATMQAGRAGGHSRAGC